jgi:hypothetical protein
MSVDRDIANAISDGINCVAEILSALGEAERGSDDEPGSARPEWPEALQAMERAFGAVVAGEVVTSLAAHGEDIGRIRRMRALVLDWLKHGRAGEELKALADATLSSFGLPVGNPAKDRP